MTIKEVARLAGVSPAAVSRYLNGGSISEEKRERVRKAIEETGYRPNPMAQTMRTGRINQVGVIVPRLYSDSVSQITAGAARRLFEQGYMTLLGCTEHDSDTELNYLHMMQESQAAGIILMGSVLTPRIAETIRESRVPVVITGQNFEGFPCVYHDDFNAVKDLTRLLIEKGRRRIVMLGAPEQDIAAGLNRRRGAEQALLDAGMDPTAMPYAVSPFEAQGAKRVMQGLLDRHPDLDGVVCATDTMAMGAMFALKEAGKRIPADVSIVGVGNNWMDNISEPPLTTAHLFFGQCGEEAARLLLEILEEESTQTQNRQIRLPYMIVERGSV